MDRKIIIIDDEPLVLMLMEEKLKRAGFHVLTSNKSVGAFDLIGAEKPDLVILDWMLPEISGLALCAQLKNDEELSSIPVFMVSAREREEEKQKALDAGATRFIRKPFSPARLLEQVMEVLGIKDISELTQ